MVIEILGALSLPVWLGVEELMRLRATQAERAVHTGPSAVPRASGVRVVEARTTA